MNKSFEPAASALPTKAYPKHWFAETDKSFDGRLVLDVFSTLLSYRWSILFLFVLGCVVGVLKAVNENPIYRAQLSMLVEPSNARTTGCLLYTSPSPRDRG